MTLTSIKVATLLVLACGGAWAQVNAGEQPAETNLPFTTTTVATFKLPWRLAFLPDGRMLVTEKAGPVWLVSQQGEKIPVGNTPAVYVEGQNGMLGGICVAPLRDRSHHLSHLR